jgi:hypothetical protein
MKLSSRCNDRSSVGAVELFLVNLNDNGISERLVYWWKCFICQEDKHEALKSPPIKIDLVKSGYRTLSKNIPE